jgi:POT family proton-dependent oligopeptide transporter
VLGSRALGTAGLHPAPSGSPGEARALRRNLLLSTAAGFVLVAGVVAAVERHALRVTPEGVTSAYGYALLAVTVAFFGWLFLDRRWTPVERSRLYIIAVFFVAAALFWSVFEQAGTTLNLFADRSTANVIFGRAFPSSWWQSLNSLLIFGMAPAFAWLWVALGKRQPASPTKFAAGLVCAGLGFLVLVPAAQDAVHGVRVGMGWLFATYTIHTIGEMCLSPVGLSSMTKLAPERIVSLMMGVWFLGASVGNFLGGQAASFYEEMPLGHLLGSLAVLPIVAGVLMFLFRKPLTALMRGVT